MTARSTKTLTKEEARQIVDRDPEIQRILSEPAGAPIPKLTRRQALAIVTAGIGARPDLPPGSAYVRKVKRYWRSLVPGGRRSS